MLCNARMRLCASIPALLTPLCIVGVSAADIVVSNYVSDTQFEYRVNQMPDLDQKRSGVPGDGRFHCSPTASLNLILYAANFGFPDVQPGPNNWQAQANHGAGTGLVNIMGSFMQTSFTPGDPGADPPTSDTGGTSTSNAIAGMQWYLDFQPDYFVLNQHLATPGFAPNFVSIGKSLIGGGVGTLSYGRYDIVGWIGTVPMIVRDNGHVTTVTRTYRNGNDTALWVRDPGSTDSIHSQSGFANRVLDVSSIMVFVMNGNTNPPTPVGYRVMTALNYHPSQTRLALVDGHMSLRPKAGYSFSNANPGISLNTPATFSNGHNPPPTHQHIELDLGTVVDATYSAYLNEFLVIAGDEGKESLYRVNPLNGLRTPVPLPVPGTPKIFEACATGTHVVVTVDSLIVLDGDLEPVATEELTLNFEKIRYDYAQDRSRPDQIVLASLQERKAFFYPMDLSTPVVRDIPTLIPGNLVDMAIEPGTGRIWLRTDESSVFYGLLWDASGNVDIEFLSHPMTLEATSIDFDDAGNLVACSRGRVVVLRRGPNGWEPNVDSLFFGIECEGKFRMMRSTNNYDPEFHDAPGWTTNIDPDDLDELGFEVLDCVGDFNSDGQVNVSDLLILLGSWGQGLGNPADLNFDGVVDVSDLLLLFAAWGPCGS